MNIHRPHIFSFLICAFVGHKQFAPDMGGGQKFSLFEITPLRGPSVTVQLCERCGFVYGYKHENLD